MQHEVMDRAARTVRAVAAELAEHGIDASITLSFKSGKTLVVIESGPNHAIYQQAA